MFKEMDKQLIIRDVIAPVQKYFSQKSRISFQFCAGNGTLLATCNPSSNFYGLLHKSGKGKKYLKESQEALISGTVRQARSSIDVCPFTGLLQACIPVTCQGSVVGFWMLGQTILPEEERSYQYYDQYLHEISRIIGLHVYPLRKLLHELPEVPQDAFIESVSMIDAATLKLMQSWLEHTARATARRKAPASPAAAAFSS